MRILFVTDLRYPPQGLGGARVSTHQLCEMLQERGHDVAVAAQVDNRGMLWLWNRLRAKITRRKCPADSVVGYPVYRGWDPLGGIREVVQDFQPDVAITGTAATLALACETLRQKVPTIAYFRALEFEKFGDPPSDRRLLGAFAVSPYTADRVEQVLGIPCRVVRSIVKHEYYRVDGDHQNVLHVNPDECKGIDITLALARRRPDIAFDVVRCWPRTPGIERIEREIENLPNVHWHEPVSDMRPLYGRARLLIAPSLCEEASGRVVQEAQLNGIPVLASNRGGLPDSVGAGGMVLDPNAEIDPWLDALNGIWGDPDRYATLSTAAWRHARRREIQPAAIVERVEQLLREHVHTGRARCVA